MAEINIKPIGEVKTEVDPKISKEIKNKENISKIIIFDDYRECLDGIEGFSHLIICYWAHLVSKSQRKIRKVHPKSNPKFPEVGIFATHSQVRPNPICLTIVRLVKSEKNFLIVKNLDALQNSPILDIKPHIPTLQESNDIELPHWANKIIKNKKKENLT
jgi:tRNA-Thr(GGU) m(6)t(6)A37 methyltransferase TsaA